MIMADNGAAITRVVTPDDPTLPGGVGVPVTEASSVARASSAVAAERGTSAGPTPTGETPVPPRTPPSPGSVQWNRGKEKVVLDLNRSEDYRRARELAEAADVLVESFRPG